MTPNTCPGVTGPSWDHTGPGRAQVSSGSCWPLASLPQSPHHSGSEWPDRDPAGRSQTGHNCVGRENGAGGGWARGRAGSTRGWAGGWVDRGCVVDGWAGREGKTDGKKLQTDEGWGQAASPSRPSHCSTPTGQRRQCLAVRSWLLTPSPGYLLSCPQPLGRDKRDHGRRPPPCAQRPATLALANCRWCRSRGPLNSCASCSPCSISWLWPDRELEHPAG